MFCFLVRAFSYHSQNDFIFGVSKLNSTCCVDSHQPWGSPLDQGRDGLAHWPTCGLAAPHTDSGFGVGDSASSSSASWRGGYKKSDLAKALNWKTISFSVIAIIALAICFACSFFYLITCSFSFLKSKHSSNSWCCV